MQWKGHARMHFAWHMTHACMHHAAWSSVSCGWGAGAGAFAAGCMCRLGDTVLGCSGGEDDSCEHLRYHAELLLNWLLLALLAVACSRIVCPGLLHPAVPACPVYAVPPLRLYVCRCTMCSCEAQPAGIAASPMHLQLLLNCPKHLQEIPGHVSLGQSQGAAASTDLDSLGRCRRLAHDAHTAAGDADGPHIAPVNACVQFVMHSCPFANANSYRDQLRHGTGSSRSHCLPVFLITFIR